LVFFFLRPFLSSSLSFKRYTQRQQKKRERAEIHDDTAARETTTAKEQRQKSSLSPPLKNYFHRLRGERERERETEREQKRKREELVVLRETFFFSFARKKKRISQLISSHLCWKDYASRAAKRRKKRRRRRWWRRW
jgi:hypothetical protein